MDDALELTDPEHADAQEAAKAAARLLVAVHEQRQSEPANGDVSETEGAASCPAT